LYNNINYWICL